MKRLSILLILLSFMLTGCITVIPGQVQTDATNPKVSAETTAEGSQTGWVTENSKTYYVKEDGTRHTGWLELNGTRYYLDKQGVLQTGWLISDGQTYYLKADGSVSRGKTTIDDRTHYFTATGEKIIVANPWNIIPSDYEPDLRDIEDGYSIDKVCKDALEQMLADCRAAGHKVSIISAYRRRTTQITLYNNKVEYYLNQGLDAATARKEAGKEIAMPGTSEHELGLAVDLVDSNHTNLDASQENTATQKWLMAHSWEYGFILRYPNNKSEKTGIIYEPWHYRYVGKDLAKVLHSEGLCLEEYLEKLQ